MKRTDTVMKIASGLVFLAMIAYLAVYIVNRFVDPVQTALVVTATMSDSSAMSGLVVRDETVLKGDAPYIDVVVDDGEKVSVGQTVAVIYGSGGTQCQRESDPQATATSEPTVDPSIRGMHIFAALEDADLSVVQSDGGYCVTSTNGVPFDMYMTSSKNKKQHRQ